MPTFTTKGSEREGNERLFAYKAGEKGTVLYCASAQRALTLLLKYNKDADGKEIRKRLLVRHSNGVWENAADVPKTEGGLQNAHGTKVNFRRGG